MPVKRLDDLCNLIQDLKDTLLHFRETHGFGRGIAAPQIGVLQRVAVIHIDDPISLINPTIYRRSRNLMTLWDDCFSFPDLLVEVQRNLEIEVRYRDASWASKTLKASGPLSELLQHEIYHLDGILAIDRAIDSQHIVYRSEYSKHVKPGAAMMF